jgi:hypothetical protein
MGIRWKKVRSKSAGIGELFIILKPEQELFHKSAIARD